ncbi:alpha/beta fold hydrolase [Micromonospora sp. NPDC004704]
MIGTILACAAAAVAVPVVGGLAYRTVLRRRGGAKLTINTPNGIAEERFVRIGGIDQWIGIRGEDRDNPVLLVVHGGPGSPYSVFTPLLRSWERHFTVVHWDRRGAGKTLGRNGRSGSGEMTFDRMVEDGIEVVEFLRRHLRKDRVILLAGSMGTLVGIPLVQRRPDLFSAYVGTDHYVDMARNEAQGLRLTLDRLRAAGNTRAVAILERIDPDPSRWDLSTWGRKMNWTMKTDPVEPNAVTKLLFPLALTSPTHSLRDVVHLASGFAYSQRVLFEQFMSYDARRYGTRFEVPFFLFQGSTDVLTLTTLAQEYYAEVQAPTKALVLIGDASHFAAFTQPDRFLDALLTHVRHL